MKTAAPRLTFAEVAEVALFFGTLIGGSLLMLSPLLFVFGVL